jgi:hypothetical protein
MKYLLDNKLAPLTFEWGFIEAPLSVVSAAYRRWQRTILHRVKATTVNLPLVDALQQLAPLDRGGQRILFLSTGSAWTACFDNGVRGGNPTTFVGELSQQLKCRGVAVGCVPDTLSRADGAKPGTWGAVKFTLFAAEKRDFLNIARSVSIINDVGGWEFNNRGTVQDFEQADRYAERKIADRLTSSMLEDYCRALGIRLFDEDFYGGPGVVTHARPWFLPKLATTPLAEARRQIGFSD